MFAAETDDGMCPVIVATAIVRRVRGYTDVDEDTFKNNTKGKMTEIASPMTIRKKLREYIGFCKKLD